MPGRSLETLNHRFPFYGATQLVTNEDLSAEESAVPHYLVELTRKLDFLDFNFSFLEVSLPPYELLVLTDRLRD